jgi:hypothetical protein
VISQPDQISYRGCESGVPNSPGIAESYVREYKGERFIVMGCGVSNLLERGNEGGIENDRERARSAAA